jgi:tmRNA-binding protein
MNGLHIEGRPIIERLKKSTEVHIFQIGIQQMLEFDETRKRALMLEQMELQKMANHLEKILIEPEG